MDNQQNSDNVENKNSDENIAETTTTTTTTTTTNNNNNTDDIEMFDNQQQQQQQQQLKEIIENREKPIKLLQSLNKDIETFMLSLIVNDKDNQIFQNDIFEKNIDSLLSSAKNLENYFVEIQNKYSVEKDKIKTKQELNKIKKEIENKNILIDKYRNKVKEWKSHFEPLYKSQHDILHSSAQVLSSDIGTPFSPIPQTPMPNTPSILSSLSQPTPPSSGFGTY
eukprot:gene4556-5677_t